MFSVTWIISVVILVISFAGIIFSALIFTKPVDEMKVSFFRMFPFEMARNSENNSKYYTFSTYLFSGVCFLPLLIAVEETTSLAKLMPLSIIISCVLGLAALCFVFLNIFDVTHTKPHLALFSIFLLLTILSGALIFSRGLTCYNIFLNYGKKEIIFLVTEILAIASFIFCLIIAFNPKLREWARLDKVDDKYVRPKKFPLAYSEWGILFALFFNEIIYFVQLLVK